MTIIATVNENAATVPVINGVAADGACASRQTANRKTADTRKCMSALDSPPHRRDNTQGKARSPAQSNAAIEPYAAHGNSSIAGIQSKPIERHAANKLHFKVGGVNTRVSAWPARNTAMG